MASPYLVDLFDGQGRRKYHNADERRALLKAAEASDKQTRLFLNVLLYTGARMSEALALSNNDIVILSYGAKLRFRTIKKKKGTKASYRSVLIPQSLAEDLAKLAYPKDAGAGLGTPKQPLWNWTRQTAWKKVKVAMLAANLPTHLAHTQAIRHGYGIAAASTRPAMPIFHLTNNLGHSCEASVRCYYEAVGFDSSGADQAVWAALE